MENRGYDEYIESIDPSGALSHDGFSVGPSRWRALVEDIKMVLPENFGYELDEIEMIETPKYIFKDIDEFSNFMMRDGNEIFGDTIIITMKDDSFFRLIYIDKINLYAVDYRPSELLEDDAGHEVYSSTYNQVH